MKGMEALQKTADLTYSNEIPTSVYNPSGMYPEGYGGLRPGVSSARHPAARHHEEVLPAAGQGEEDGEAGSSQDGPHPLLRQVHGRALAPWYAGYTVQLLSVLYSVTSK